jgi:hypothetical protein
MRAAPIALLTTMLLVGSGCNNDKPGEVGPASTLGDMGTGGTALIRIAQLSPNKPPIDVCLAVHGSNKFTGPILKPAGVAATGLAYSQVSKYLAVPGAQYDVRIVDGGATTCAQSLFDANNLPVLFGGGAFTIVGTGFIPPNPNNPTSFTVIVYTDNTTTNEDKALLRFIHDAPDVPPLNFGIGSGASFSELFADVSFLHVGGNMPVSTDGNGYASINPTAPPITYSVRQVGSATDALTVSSPLALPANSLTTVFAIGDLGGTPKPLQMLVCSDNSPPIGPLTACTALP